MTENSWEDEMVRWLNVIDKETTHSLNVIKDDIQRSGLTINSEFEHIFLKTGINMMKNCCKEFDMKLRMRESLKRGVTLNIMNVDAIANVPDVSMKNITSNCHNENITSSYIESTPLHAPFGLSDHLISDNAQITNEVLTPDSTWPTTAYIISDTNQAVAKKSKYQRELMCYYCKELKIRDIPSFVFGNIRAIHTHCQSEHSTDPFQYYAIDLLNCGVDECRYYSTFFGLHKHHTKKHPNDIFVVVQNKHCAFCHYNGNDLNKHNCPKLEKAIALKIINPICLSDDELAELQPTIKGFHCKYCNVSFDSSSDMLQHHHQEHGQKIIDAPWSETKSIIGMICGCCKIQMTAASFTEHLKSVAQKRWSNTNRWETWYTQFMMEILKTKVIFGNGLVVFNQNLINTDLGGYRHFKKLAKSIFTDLKKNSQK